MPFWTYILHCNAGVFYTGHTDNLERRIAQHQLGQVEGFTARYLPVELVWSQEFTTREEAKQSEKQIKGWSRKKKLALIRGDWGEVARLAKAKGSPSTGSGQTEIRFSRTTLDAMRREAALAHPAECCGILTGEEGRITGHIPARNVHRDPLTHFEIDPATLIAAYRAEREGGARIAGFYHAHPNGLARPSATDRRDAAGDGRLWAIIAGDLVTLWRDDADGFVSLSYTAIDG